MKKFNKKLGTIKHVQFIGGPKRAHNGMIFFMKDQVFLFLASVVFTKYGCYTLVPMAERSRAGV